MRYRKVVVVEAFRYTGRWEDLNEWLSGLPVTTSLIRYPDGSLHIHTLEGTMRADVGDWIICGVRGELYPCKPDIFEATYEPEGEHPSDSQSLSRLRLGDRRARLGLVPRVAPALPGGPGRARPAGGRAASASTRRRGNGGGEVRDPCA